MQIEAENLEHFLNQNRIKKDDWKKSGLTIELTNKILADYDSRTPELTETAEYIAKTLQKCSKVHSVRWRVKDPGHLIEKIVRKKASKNTKYENISEKNYLDTLTDLIGVRVLHLFKTDWEEIHQYIRDTWELAEKVKAYIRAGDEGSITDIYKNYDCDVDLHKLGYRSVHYIVPTQPTKRRYFVEIQVRTIFEEGWSEIDHIIRYPNFSDNKLITYFLTIFNRLAGSADEMGSFVKQLTNNIKNSEVKYQEQIEKVQKLAADLAAKEKQSEESREEVKELQEEINKLRQDSVLDSYFATPSLTSEAAASVAALSNLGGVAKSALDFHNNITQIDRDTIDSITKGIPSLDLNDIRSASGLQFNKKDED